MTVTQSLSLEPKLQLVASITSYLQYEVSTTTYQCDMSKASAGLLGALFILLLLVVVSNAATAGETKKEIGVEERQLTRGVGNSFQRLAQIANNSFINLSGVFGGGSLELLALVLGVVPVLVGLAAVMAFWVGPTVTAFASLLIPLAGFGLILLPMIILGGSNIHPRLF
jgi:hypothetical protein